MDHSSNVVEKQILELTDNMAAAAVSFSSHGYDSFLNARESFIEGVHELLTRVEQPVTM